MASSKIFARSAANVIPRTRQAVGAKNYDDGVFHQKETYRVRCPSKRWHIQSAISHQSHIPRFVNSTPEFSVPEDRVNFWVPMDNSMCRNRPNVTAKIKKNHVFRMLHPPYSPEVRPCDFWLFEMLRQILNDRKFSSSDEIEDAIAQVWNGLTFDDVQSFFRDWIRRFTWVAENDGEYMNE
jgi:hypothetical protein